MEHPKIEIIKPALPKNNDILKIPEERLLSKQEIENLKRAETGDIRLGGSLKHRCFYVSDRSRSIFDKYEWVLGEDELGATVLVPLKKQS